MRKKVYTGLLLLLILFISGCVNWCKDRVLRYYITHYSVSRDISLFDARKYVDGVFDLHFSWVDGKIISYDSKGNDLQTFKELANKSGDKGYNEFVECANLNPPSCRCFSSVPISRINITCNKDVDVIHPVGSSLNDLFLFISCTPDRYIRNNFQPLNFDTEEELKSIEPQFHGIVKGIRNIERNSVEVIYGVLAEINFPKYLFVGIPSRDCRMRLGFFSWVTPPEGLTDYTLTVEVEYADGVTKSASLHVKD